MDISFQLRLNPYTYRTQKTLSVYFTLPEGKIGSTAFISGGLKNHKKLSLSYYNSACIIDRNMIFILFCRSFQMLQMKKKVYQYLYLLWRYIPFSVKENGIFSYCSYIIAHIFLSNKVKDFILGLF